MYIKKHEPHPWGAAVDRAPTRRTGEHNTTTPLHQSPMRVPAVCTRPLFQLQNKKAEQIKKIQGKKKGKKRKLEEGRRDATTRSTRKTHTACAPVNRRQVAQDSARAHALRAAEEQDATVYTPISDALG